MLFRRHHITLRISFPLESHFEIKQSKKVSFLRLFHCYFLHLSKTISINTKTFSTLFYFCFLSSHDDF
jgi:hypothetical protein